MFLHILALMLCLPSGEAVLHVSPEGDDRWSGRLEAPNDEGTDGPLASLAAARNAARWIRGNGPVVVRIAGGRYTLGEPLIFLPEDSGAEEAPPTRRSAREEERVLSREEVQRLLDQLQEIEEQARAVRALLRERRRIPVEKDW